MGEGIFSLFLVGGAVARAGAKNRARAGLLVAGCPGSSFEVLGGVDILVCPAKLFNSGAPSPT